MDLQKGDLVIYDGEECEVVLTTDLRSKTKIKDSGGTEFWVNKNKVERVYKFRENEKCYFDAWQKKRECVIEKVLDKNKGEERIYLIYIPNRELYSIAYERDLLKRKSFDDLEEGDSFFLPSGEKIRIGNIVFDDCFGIYRYLIKRENGRYDLIEKSVLKGWV